MTHLPPPLIDLADAYGVLTEYHDVSGRLRVASVETLLATLNLLGAEIDSPDQSNDATLRRIAQRAGRGVEPVVVGWEGCEIEFPIVSRRGAAESVRVTLDGPGDPLQFDFGPSHLGDWHIARLHEFDLEARRVAFHLPAGFPTGYWRMKVEIGGRAVSSLLIHAPRRAFGADERLRAWGAFLPVYSIRSERNWGAGDFTDLRELTEWLGRRGAGTFGTLPLLASFLDEPCDPSPYSPVTRLFWNEFYIDVERVPEFAACDEAKRRVASDEFRRELSECRSGDYIDYARLMRLKRGVIESMGAMMNDGRAASNRRAAFESFVADTACLEDYGEYRAAHERLRRPWWEWPARMRDGELRAEDFDPAAKRYHLYAQWIAAEQLGETLDPAAAVDSFGKPSAQLYLDLPLGVRRDAYDVWRNQASFITRSSVGAPPDAIFTGGQNWGFCPLHPDHVRELGYTHVRHYLSRHMEAARMLRIDHVMGLHRLFWIPDGRPASDGVYVRYRADEFYAILSIESHRHQTRLLGENLGTVPPGVNEAMDEHAVRRMFVVQYELQGEERDDHEGTRPPLADPPGNAVASLNTHDMPMFAAWWRGEDIDDRRRMDLMDDQDCQAEHHVRERQRESLKRWARRATGLDEPSEVDVLGALLEYLAGSPAELMLVNLEDLWQETRPQNIPGTWKERPNWRRRADWPLEKLRAAKHIDALFGRLQRARTQ